MTQKNCTFCNRRGHDVMNCNSHHKIYLLNDEAEDAAYFSSSIFDKNTFIKIWLYRCTLSKIIVLTKKCLITNQCENIELLSTLLSNPAINKKNVKNIYTDLLLAHYFTDEFHLSVKYGYLKKYIIQKHKDE